MSESTVIWLKEDSIRALSPNPQGRPGEALIALGHEIGLHGGIYSIEKYQSPNASNGPIELPVPWIGIRTDEHTAFALKLKYYEAKTDEQFRADMTRWEEAIAEINLTHQNMAMAAASIGRAHGTMVFGEYAFEKPSLFRRIRNALRRVIGKGAA